MALLDLGDAAVLMAQVRRLRQQATHHKSEIKRHRQQLHSTMAAVADLEEECRRRGLHPGEGQTIHGHSDRT